MRCAGGGSGIEDHSAAAGDVQHKTAPFVVSLLGMANPGQTFKNKFLSVQYVLPVQQLVKL